MFNFFIALSLNGNVSFSLTSGKGNIDFPDEFMTIFKTKLNEAIQGVEDKKQK
jgi:hypothetical protein